MQNESPHNDIFLSIVRLFSQGDTASLVQARALADAIAEPELYRQLAVGVSVSAEGRLSYGQESLLQRIHSPQKGDLLLWLACKAGLLDAQRVLSLSDEDDFCDLSPLEGLPLEELVFLGSWADLDTVWGDSLYSSRTQLPRLPELSSLKRVRISEFAKLVDISSLASLSSLEKLEIVSCESLSDLQCLSSLSSLQSITLINLPKLSEISFLRDLPKIRFVHLEQMRLQEISALESLPRLEELFCRNSLLSESVVLRLPLLQKLSLVSEPRLRDLSILSAMPALRSLVLGPCDLLEDISELSKLSSLQSLLLDACKKLKSLDALSGLSQLASLCLRSISLHDLSPLATLPIEKLTLSFCMPIQELRVLNHHPTLKILEVASCNFLRQLCDLSTLPALVSLQLSGCRKLVLSEAQLVSETLEELLLQDLSLPKVTTLPPSPRLARLRLEMLRGVERLCVSSYDKLSSLNVGICEDLQELTLCHLPVLGNVQVSGQKLQKLSIDGDTSIEALTVQSAPKLRVLEISETASVRKKTLHGCSRLSQ